MKQWLINGRLFDGDSVHEECAVQLDGPRVARIVLSPAVEPEDGTIIDLEGRMLAPGLLDLQVNGGGGVLFNDQPDLDALRTMVAAHRRSGTVAMLPTLISDDADTMRAGIAAVHAALDAGEPGIAGIHLEGPHLNRSFAGVHDGAQFRDIDDDAWQLLTSLGGGRTLVTLAPESIPVARITSLRDAGVIVWGGHSGASSEQTAAALAAGLSGFTHLFNAMPPFLSRDPGMVGAALADEDSYIGLIVDGFHLHPLTVRVAIRAKTHGKTVLVTDAMPPAGSDATSFELNGETIEASGGRCVTADGKLAGSCIGLLDAVRNTVACAGIPLEEGLRMASLYPAQAIGLDREFGRVRPGMRASLIEIDDDCRLYRSWIDGDCEAYD